MKNWLSRALSTTGALIKNIKFYRCEGSGVSIDNFQSACNTIMSAWEEWEGKEDNSAFDQNEKDTFIKNVSSIDVTSGNAIKLVGSEILKFGYEATKDEFVSYVKEKKMFTVDYLSEAEKKIGYRIVNTPPSHNAIDGIIDVERYVAAKYKILWILKEVNFGDDPKIQGNWNMVKFYQNATLKEINDILTAKRVMLATHRILNDLDTLEAFKSVACINIKKLPGGSHTKDNDAEIQQAYNDHDNKALLLDQISLYSPDLIICGNTLHYFENDLNFRQGEEKCMEMDQRHYFCTKERLYINAYHPAYPKITDQEYCDKIFNAFSFWEANYR